MTTDRKRPASPPAAYFDDLHEVIVGERIENGFDCLNGDGLLQARHGATGVDEDDDISWRGRGSNVPVLHTTIE